MTMISFANRGLPRIPARTSPFTFASQQILAGPLPRTQVIPNDLDQARLMLSEAERVILSQEERIRQLENMALTDELTGLVNRRGLMNALRRELALTRRNRKHGGLLILLDLDGFKQVNDIYGHAIGDQYLQTVASVLLNEVRSSDIVSRLGGDEFAILLPEIDAKEAGARLQKLDKIFNSRVMHHREHSVPLRGSWGFAMLSEEESPESLMIAADMKLYADKAKRRAGMI